MTTEPKRSARPGAGVTRPSSGAVRLATAGLAGALLLSTVAALAQNPAPVPHGKSQLKGQVKEAPPAAQQPQGKVPLPPPEQMAMLIQTAVVALSQANLTGNFTVLHAMGAPSFQQSNSPAKLAEIFKTLREQNIDLTPVILFSPVLLREPVITDQGMLHLVGYYKTTPQQVNFEVLFQAVQGQWRLFGLSVRTSPASAAQAAPAPPAAASSTDPGKKTK